MISIRIHQIAFPQCIEDETTEAVTNSIGQDIVEISTSANIAFLNLLQKGKLQVEFEHS